MTLEIVVEEPSMEEALRHIVPKIVDQRVRFKLINMRIKGRLLQKLPQRLKAYRSRIANGEQLRILILVDQDNDDCRELKKRLDHMAREAGLVIRGPHEGLGEFHVVNRIVVKELESWFMGDELALKKALSGLSGAAFPRTSPLSARLWISPGRSAPLPR